MFIIFFCNLSYDVHIFLKVSSISSYLRCLKTFLSTLYLGIISLLTIYMLVVSLKFGLLRREGEVGDGGGEGS